MRAPKLGINSRPGDRSTTSPRCINAAMMLFRTALGVRFANDKKNNKAIIASTIQNVAQPFFAAIPSNVTIYFERDVLDITMT